MDHVYWKVLAIRPETPQASTFLLRPESGFPIPYQAGQFLTLLFHHLGETERRSYSFSSAPGIDEEVSITIKRIPNGSFSRQLLDHARVGDRIRSLMPAGRFTIDTQPTAKRLFIFFAAGSGITPIYSLLKKVLEEEPASEAVLIFQNRHENDIIFRTQLDQLQIGSGGRFHWLNLLSRPVDKRSPAHKLTNSMVEELVRRYQQPTREALFYLCGPLSFMRMVQFTLRWLGIEEEKIKREFFTVEHIPGPPLMEDKTDKNVVIRHGETTWTFKTAYPVNILQSAINNRIQLPFSCRAGRCSTCVAKCISGSVKMSVNEVLTEDDIKKGLVLTCVGYAETDLELEV